MTHELKYTDSLSYGLIIEFIDGEPVARRRESVFDLGAEEAVSTMERYFTSRGNRMEYRVGKLGNEKLYYAIEPRGDGQGEVIRIDGSGVPATCGWVNIHPGE